MLNDFKFRCHTLKDLMADSKDIITPKQLKTISILETKPKLTEKQAQELERLIIKRDTPPKLSKTTEDLLRSIFIQEVYGRIKDTSSKFTLKGLSAEDEGIELAKAHYGKFFAKNTKEYSNDCIKGTPDIVLGDKVIDIKCSWDIDNFMRSKETFLNYYWQMQGYMWLTGTQSADLAFCLCNAPEYLIAGEKNREMWKYGYSQDSIEYMELEAQIEKNMMFDDIPAKDRIKIYTISFNTRIVDKIKKRYGIAIDYLNKLEL